MACAEAEHAVQVAEFGPLAPSRIDTCPAARLMMAEGMKNGEILRGPPSSSALCSRSMVVKPPMPDAMKTPTRRDCSGLICSCASSIANCDAAIAYWMKMSIFLTYFFSMNASGSKPLTSPAMRVANCEASNLVMVSTPLRPALIPAQFASVPIPSDDTRPMPVTTTRRLLVMALLLGLGVRFDVLDGFLDACDLLGILVRDFDAELFFERHHELDGVERVGAEVVHERRVRRHFFFIDPELLHDDALHFVGYGHSILLHVHPAVDGENVPCNIRCLVGGKKAHCSRHIVHRPQTRQRNLPCPVGVGFFGHRPRHLGIDQPWRDHVHGNCPRCHFPRESFDEPDNARLRRRIVRLSGIADLPND